MSTEYENIKTNGVLLTRFYGGASRGVCLQITKENSFREGYLQATLKDAKKLQNKLNKSITGFCFEVAEGFYIDHKQCKALVKDLNLFINDPIHTKD